ncbi:unnamed protein product [Spirodela intermedia]|uniref:NAC domain-containing protein n=1 Tax=Spirodela intermedia TaxID=51605 RepID=A0A7I8KHK6_SPIIN|nr:unnamed protein product [Spirodela intermedia]CAA7397012.1 unnamed protein product [Spirodela intermedia]
MSRLPPGLRFYPTEVELVTFYLRNKLADRSPEIDRFIPAVDVYSFHPMELPPISGEASIGDPEQWFFFCPRQEREAQGGRPTRTTRYGYWKATGSPTQVIHEGRPVGRRTTMVFYEGRPQSGRKTSWKMNEYTAYDETSAPGATQRVRREFCLCRLYKKTEGQRSFDRRPTVAALSKEAGDMNIGVSNTPAVGNLTRTAAEEELYTSFPNEQEQAWAGIHDITDEEWDLSLLLGTDHES